MLRIYLDNCCLNRPFDDQNQLRIKVESDIIISILESFKTKTSFWVGSEVIQIEINKTQNTERRKKVEAFLIFQNSVVKINEPLINRAKNIERFGFSFMDALHLESAIAGKADIFITTDDEIIKIFRKVSDSFNIKVISPIDFMNLEKKR